MARPESEPQQLSDLRERGGENFGILSPILDQVFGGVCAYCERQPLWRSPGDGLGALDTDLPDESGLPFTCDHFRPRRLLCSRELGIGQCREHVPPHSPGCPIYDWRNLVYACQSCNAVKGGQWPSENDAADSYIDPCAEPGSGNTPDAVFEYDLESGEIRVRPDVKGVDRANAERTINDLALNHHRDYEQSLAVNAETRKVDLAELRRQWITAFGQSLDRMALLMPDLLPAFVAGMVSPNARFSSICRQVVEQSDYRRYLV